MIKAIKTRILLFLAFQMMAIVSLITTAPGVDIMRRARAQLEREKRESAAGATPNP